jgi:hypothetical protein
VMACYGISATCQLKRYHTQFQEVVIRSIPISDTVASVNGRVVAGERHGMCESAFRLRGHRDRPSVTVLQLLVARTSMLV